MSENLSDSSSNEKGKPSRPELTMDEIALLPGAIDIKDFTHSGGLEQTKPVYEMWREGMDKRLLKKGYALPPNDESLWPDHQWIMYNYLQHLYEEYNANADLVFDETVKNAVIHGNRNKPGFPVRVTAGWHKNCFYFAVQDGGKGIAEGIKNNKTGKRSEGGLGIALNWGGKEAYTRITEDSHTLFLVRDINDIEEPLYSHDSKKNRRFISAVRELGRRIKRGESLELTEPRGLEEFGREEK